VARGPRSLRARLTLWYAAALAVPLVAFAVISYLAFAVAVRDRTDRDIADAMAVFAREVGAERRHGSSAREAIVATVNEMRFRDVRFIVRDRTGAVVAMGTDADFGVRAGGDRVLAELASRTADSGAVTIAGPLGGDRVITQALQVDGEPFRISGAYPMRDSVEVLESLRVLFTVAIPLLVVTAAVGAYFIANRGLAPVSAMAVRAGEITASNLHERLPVAGGAELTRLARVFNELLDRLENAFAQQRRFMADASHELRTPTAVLRAEAEVTLAREQRTDAEYRESIGVMLQASQRLTRIVDDLFLLARADAGHLVMRAEPVYLEEVVHDATRAVVQVGERRGVRVELRSMTQAPVTGDPDLLGRVLLNLLDNAIKYSPTDGTVEVAMASAPGRHVISVIDQGPGIAPEAVESIFERFYRGDAARSRPAESVTDGAGLGLAIARRIAVAHGGTLVVAESRPGRTEFRLTLPATS
jgi:heavy metal sensor kinase